MSRSTVALLSTIASTASTVRAAPRSCQITPKTTASATACGTSESTAAPITSRMIGEANCRLRSVRAPEGPPALKAFGPYCNHEWCWGMTAAGQSFRLAAAAAVVAYGVATAVELVLIAVFRPTEWELTWISDAFLASVVGISTYLWLHLRATRAALSTAERARLVLDTQLEVAAHLQRSLLPVLPEDQPTVSWGAQLQPAGQIGGDFYDLVPFPDGTVAFVLADIAGKGIPAAMMLVSTRASFRTLVHEHRQPVALASRLSSAINDNTGGQAYVTCIVGRIDTEAAILTCVNAGHPPGLVVRDDGVVRLDLGGPPAGLLPEAAYAESVVALQPGDRVVFVTDGITEALEPPSGSPLESIAAIVRGLGRQVTPAAICDALIAEAVKGPGPAGVDDWHDDRTVLAFTVGPRP